jgi:hypothetical protein
MPNKETEKKPRGSLFPFVFTIGALVILFLHLWTTSIYDKRIGCAVLIGGGVLGLLIRKPYSAMIAEHQAKFRTSPWSRSLASYEYTLKLATCTGSLMLLFGIALLLQMALVDVQRFIKF